MATDRNDSAIARPRLTSVAAVVGGDWTHGEYYDQAEAVIDNQWEALIWPLISYSDFGNVVEIAAGHGRNTAKLARVPAKLTATDINQTNIDFHG